MRNNPVLKANLIKSTSAIKHLIQSTYSNVMEVIEVTLEDWDYGDDELLMVLIGIRFKIYSENEIHEVSKQIENVSDKIDSALSMIGFTSQGTICSPKNSNVEFSESGLIQDIQYDEGEETIEMVVDYMFWSGESV